MIEFLRRLLKKYNNLSIEIKAAAWYAFGNIIQKIAPWLVMIILTHYVSVEDYGMYSVFLSWMEIFEIVITLKIYSNGYVAGLVRECDNKEVYTSSLQILCIILIISWLIIYLIIHNIINYITGMSTLLSVVMICSFIATTGFGLWSSRQRVLNKYKKMIIAIIIYGFFGPVIGALSIFMNLKNPILYVIAIRILIQFIVTIPFLKSNLNGDGILWDKRYALDSLKYNLPLMPYYLSMILLNHSDRLMIQKIDGYSDAALYSVSYSAAMIIFVVSGALNLSLQAWLFKELKIKDSSIDKSKLITMGTMLVSFFAIMEIILAPEMIWILGGKKYLDAIWVIPPLAISVIVMYIYQQYVNVLFYYKKTKFILLGSMFATFCNIILNYIYIPKFGYIAGGYTSLLSYTIVMIFYFILAKKECAANDIFMGKYFNTKLQFIIICFTVIITFFVTCLYNNMIIRYLFSAIIVMVMIIKRKRWIGLFNKGI